MRSTERDGRPSAFVWLVALISLVLPVAGVGAALYGTFLVFKQEYWGWLWLAAGLVMLVGDLVLDQTAGLQTGADGDDVAVTNSSGTLTAARDT